MTTNEKICLIAGCGPGTGTESVKNLLKKVIKLQC